MNIESPVDLSPSLENSEFAVLSALMHHPELFDECSKLQPEHFVTDWLRSVFIEMKRQNETGYFDAFTLAEQLEGITNPEEIGQIHSGYIGSGGLKTHIQRLIDRTKSRQLYAVGGMLTEMAFETTPIQERLDKVSLELSKLEDTDDFGQWIDAHESAIKHLELIEQREEGKSHGIPSGLNDLDEMLDGGFARGNLVVIGARPSMGKSALGLTIGLQMAQVYSVGFISLEMSRADVSDRQAAILGSISISHIKRPKKGLEYDRLIESVEKSKSRKFYVVEQGGLNIMQVKAKAKALKRKKGLDVLIVDYIGLMAGMDSKISRAYQIEEISRGLKTLAKEMGIVVVCLAQVNRGAADKGNTPPGLHELRDSGAIEQDADVVGFIHRPIMSNPDLSGDWMNYALLRVAKNRQGRCGDVHLFYVAEQTKFGQWSGSPPSKSVSTERGL